VYVRSGVAALSKCKISGCGGPGVRAAESASAAAGGPVPDVLVTDESDDTTSNSLHPFDTAKHFLSQFSGASGAPALGFFALLPAAVYCTHSDLRGNRGGSWDIPPSMWSSHSAFAYLNQVDSLSAAMSPVLPTSVILPPASSPQLVIASDYIEGKESSAKGLVAPRALELKPVVDVDPAVPVGLIPTSSPVSSSCASARRVTRYASFSTLDGDNLSQPGSIGTLDSGLAHQFIARPTAPGADENILGGEEDDDVGIAAATRKRKRSKVVSGVALVVVDRIKEGRVAARPDYDGKSGSELNGWMQARSNGDFAPSRIRASGFVDSQVSAVSADSNELAAGSLSGDRRRVFVHNTAGGLASVYLVASARRRQAAVSSLPTAHFDLLSDSTEAATAPFCDAASETAQPMNSAAAAVTLDTSEAFLVAQQTASALRGPSSEVAGYDEGRVAVHPFVIVHANAALGGLPAAMAAKRYPDSGAYAALAHHSAVAVARLQRGPAQPQLSFDAATARAGVAKERAIARLSSGGLDSGNGGLSPTTGGAGIQRSDPYAKVYISAPGQRPDFTMLDVGAAGGGSSSLSAAAACPGGADAKSGVSAPHSGAAALHPPGPAKPNKKKQQLLPAASSTVGVSAMPASGSRASVAASPLFMPPSTLSPAMMTALYTQQWQQQVLMQQQQLARGYSTAGIAPGTTSFLPRPPSAIGSSVQPMDSALPRGFPTQLHMPPRAGAFPTAVGSLGVPSNGAAMPSRAGSAGALSPQQQQQQQQQLAAAYQMQFAAAWLQHHQRMGAAAVPGGLVRPPAGPMGGMNMAGMGRGSLPTALAAAAASGVPPRPLVDRPTGDLRTGRVLPPPPRSSTPRGTNSALALRRAAAAAAAVASGGVAAPHVPRGRPRGVPAAPRMAIGIARSLPVTTMAAITAVPTVAAFHARPLSPASPSVALSASSTAPQTIVHRTGVAPE
jgi:hypothetical protein